MTSQQNNTSRLGLTISQAQKAVSKHYPTCPQSTVVQLKEIQNSGFSFTSTAKTYILDLSTPDATSSPTHSSFLSVGYPPSSPPPNDDNGPTYHPAPLSLTSHLLTLIRTQTSIPIPKCKLDTSFDNLTGNGAGADPSVIPFHYLLSPPTPIRSQDMIPLSTVRKAGLLSPRDAVLVDLQLGRFLGQLHEGVQNDAFGLPVPDTPPAIGDDEDDDDGENNGGSSSNASSQLKQNPPPPSLEQLMAIPDSAYNWQTTFSSLLESLLDTISANTSIYFPPSPTTSQFPAEEIRTHLSRAIGSFLFEDVEIPSLIWFTGSEDDIYLSLGTNDNPSSSTTTPAAAGGQASSGGAQKGPMIAAILPNVAHAIWGDPLLECLFLPEGGGDGAGAGAPLTGSARFFSQKPTEALIEGYKSARGGRTPGGATPREKVKRVWYTLFLALIVLVERTQLGGDDNDGNEPQEGSGMGNGEEKKTWARKEISRCLSVLENSPVY